MPERVKQIDGVSGRLEVTLPGGDLVVTSAPGYRVFVDGLFNARWQTISFEPDEEGVELVKRLREAALNANGGRMSAEGGDQVNATRGAALEAATAADGDRP